MQIQYCDDCNIRVDEADVSEIGGRIYCAACAAKVQVRPRAGTSGHQVATRGPSSGTRIQSRRSPSGSNTLPVTKSGRANSSGQSSAHSAGQSGSRQTRSVDADNGGSKTLVVMLCVAGVLLAGVAVFLLTKQNSKKSAPVTGTTPAVPVKPTTQTPENIVAPPATPPKSDPVTPPVVATPDVKPADAKPVAPAQTVDIMAGVREESSRRALNKLIEDEKNGSISKNSLRKRYTQFLSGSYKSTSAAKEAQERLNALPPSTFGAAEVPPAPTSPGLEVKICEGVGGLIGMPMTSFKIQQKKVVANIDMPEEGKINELCGRKDHLALIFSGYVEVPKDGAYVFYTTSDDGSILYIDDDLLVDNDGEHGMKTVSDMVELKAGKHKYRLLYQQGQGGAGVVAEWSGPDIGKQVIPASAFSHVP